MSTSFREVSRSNIPSPKFALWVGIVTIVMVFGSLTSALIVRRAAGNWYEFKLPDIFFLNTLVIIASSITLHFSYRAFKTGKVIIYRTLLLTTFVLGLAFVLLQYQGWEALNAQGATFTINPSASFIYVLSGLHAAHILGGLAALIIALVHAFLLPYKATRRRRLRFELIVQYWHFVDILWVYLFVFFLVMYSSSR